MRAAVLHGIGDLRLEEIERPSAPAQGEVLIRLRAVGVCGSDCHFYERGRIGPYIVQKPLILGHEAAGEVLEVGAGVTHLKAGDWVAIEPGVPCRKCHFCKVGKYNLCPSSQFMATPPQDGAFREYLVWPADFVFRLPENVSLEEGALVEPLAVALQALKRSEMRPADRVVVLGCGTIGLMIIQAALAAGASLVVGVDIANLRLEMAGQFGARSVNGREAEPLEAIKEATQGEGAEIVFEAAGRAETIRKSLAMVRPGGVVVIVGMAAEEEIALPIMDSVIREYDVRGVFRYANCYPPAIRLLASRKISPAALITHRFCLEEAPEAVKFALHHREEAIKVMVRS